jgi:ribosomal protein L29
MRMLSYHDLVEKLKEGQKKLFEMKLHRSAQQLKNYMSIKDLRREIARIQTIMAEKRSSGDLGASPVTVSDAASEVKKDSKAKKAPKKEKASAPKEKNVKKAKKAEKVALKK